MFARIVQVPLSSGAASAATEYFQQHVGPALKEHPSFLNSRFLVNEETNRCLMGTLWQSAEDRSAVETSGFLQEVLQAMKPYFGGPPTIDYYEVKVQES